MKLKRLSFPLALSLVALLAACGGADNQVTPPPGNPPPAPTTQAATPPAETAAAATTAATPAATTAKPEAAPQKSNKEKLVGVWVLDFSGDIKAAAEEDAKKKGGKDEKKVADLLKKAEEATAKTKVENTGDTMAMWDGDKTTSKAKYEVVKEDGNTIVVKNVGKDEISKKDAPAGEMTITFKDDNTIELKDPKEKDAKKAKTLVFKRGAASAAPAAAAKPAEKASATPAAPAAPAAPASPATPAAKPAAKPAAAAPPEKSTK